MRSESVQRDSNYLKQLKQEVYTTLTNKPHRRINLRIKMLSIIGMWMLSYCIYLQAAAVGNAIYCIPCVLFLFITSTALSFNIIHEGSHRALTASKLLNQCIQIMAACIYGISTLNWFEKHIVRHHVYTNIHTKDFDINSKGIFRFSPHDTWRVWHRWQFYYALPLYSVTVFKWIYFTDFRDLILNIYDLPIKKRFFICGEILLTRCAHIILFIVIPSYYFATFSACLIYYLLFIGLSGLTTAIIFQLAHIQSNLSFYIQCNNHAEQKLLHQLSCTANFASQNPWLTFFTGGLNMQIVHHLFPHISHIDYPTIQPIIQAFCRKNNLPHFEHPTLIAAIKAHFSFLKSLGIKPNQQK